MELNFPQVVTDLIQSRDISPEIEEAPLNTQVTLVEDAIKMKFGDSGRPKATPTRAARNEERARKEKEERARKEKEEQARKEKEEHPRQEVAKGVKTRRARAEDVRTTVKEPAAQPTLSQNRDQHQQREPEAPIESSPKTVKTEKAARKTISQPAPVAGPSQATRGAQKKATTKEKPVAESKPTIPPIEVMRNAFFQEESDQVPALTVVSEAPYRNTRARSRSVSVEPQPLSPPRKKARKKQALKSVPEDVEDVVVQENTEEAATYQDDNSVDAVEDVLGSGVNDGESEEPPKVSRQQVESGAAESGEEEETERKTVESDDDQDESSADEIDRKYAERVRKLNLHTVTTSSSPDQRAHDVPEDRNSSRHSILPASSPFAGQLLVTPKPTHGKGARDSSVVSRATPKVKKLNTATSESDFPASGTQARREKARRTERLKREPYQPPAMTKAAAIVREKRPSRHPFAT